MPKLFRKVADYFGFGQLWRVVLVRNDGTRQCHGTMWSEDAARIEADDLNNAAVLTCMRDGHPIHGHYVAERVIIR